MEGERGGAEEKFRAAFRFNARVHLRIIAILSTFLPFFPPFLFFWMVVTLGIKISYRKIKPANRPADNCAGGQR